MFLLIDKQLIKQIITDDITDFIFYIIIINIM